ncbi:hypothetical protein HYS03_01855 [Candidatus Woesebacteria bacterium]|nr:hypothetical protein [Candidatus Woesebacteria bacterium]QQG47885.1 MAG: hypothetical protein HY044_02250 [Candidatus Woesebacteria bacterium]
MSTVKFRIKDHPCKVLYQSDKNNLNEVNWSKIDELWKNQGGFIVIGEIDSLGDQERLYYDHDKQLVFSRWASSVTV